MEGREGKEEGGEEQVKIIVPVDKAMKSKYMNDIISCCDSNIIPIVISNQFASALGNYKYYVEDKRLEVNDADMIIKCLSLACYLFDDDYIQYVMSQAYRCWARFNNIITSLHEDLLREVYLYSPYPFVPEVYMSNPHFFKSWLQINGNKTITINEYMHYCVKVQYDEHTTHFNIKYTKPDHHYTIINFGKKLEVYNSETLLECGDMDGYQRLGTWTSYYDTSKKTKSQGSYVNGQKHGPWTYWYDWKCVESKGCYTNGKKEGTWEEYDYYGKQFPGTGIYINDQKHGLWTLNSYDDLYETTYDHGTQLHEWKLIKEKFIYI